MKIKPDQLKSYLQKSLQTKQLSPIFIISGDEPLLSQEAADAVRSTARQLEFTERETFDIDARFDWNLVFNETNSLSLFSDKKILELRITSGKPGDKGSKALCELCENLNDSNLILVILPKLDKGAYQSKWMKTLESKGVHIQVWPVTPEQLPRWINQRLVQCGIEASQGAVDILADRVEGNLLAAMQEINTLKLLSLEGKVNADIMSTVVADSARYNLFSFVDKVLDGDAQSAAKALRGLENEGTEPLALLWAITRELRTLNKASHQVLLGNSKDKALKSAGVWDKRIPIFRKALSRLSPAHLRMLMHQAGAIDRGVKGLRQADIWDELTTLVLSFAGSQTLHPKNIKTLLHQ
ncbi:MAG: DNA polymerase III subunit delta [Cellvibrionales bacterium TMED47]|nr:DNA polymerase III subunit delta [Porticoccaceae bacterium]RPG84563.1 MAG: DNA polymerase III subunit delta [Cellvibrionales bacterium TMED47]